MSDASAPTQPSRGHISVIHEGFSEPFALAYTVPEDIAADIEERDRRHAPKSIGQRIRQFLIRKATRHATTLTYLLLACSLYLCGWLYIGALWDPAARIATLLVALVNRDQGIGDRTAITTDMRTAFMASWLSS
ncbi:hypothetical protein SYNPS1DRAFT_21976 [Syncephalis pseudoplumigaleata]|uniref:Uncharacterized protein n=1 Tax=Syncephalis pseudoplumigaleata TaxID=1712513 RepID=A0A4P9Z3U7_9FUNG|nr:hypothetical protein SYNPS1DRAFT_21976 [Syncephalis pseudoplumigaleata]|eukprot:RKP26210.1 hypothetical protein SYNPS1DRAFT_21976 [Syncephalis pseudoplumigaleata]